MQVYDDRFQTESGWSLKFHPDSAWKRSSETCMKRSRTECTVEILLTMGRDDARNM